MQEVLNNANVSQLKADISRAEAQLQQLATRLGDKHPQVEEAKASLAELRSRLEAETRKVTGSVTVSANINRQRLAEVQRALQAQRDKVLKMKAVRDEGLVLLRDVENAQRSYDALLQRFTQTSLAGQTTQSNINLLTQATPPLEPSSPRIVLNTLLSIFLGTLLAVGTALVLELPVLGLMPKPGTQLQLGAGRVSPMQQRLMAPLPQSTQGA